MEGDISVRPTGSNARQLEHARRLHIWGQFFFSAGRVTLLHETGFLHIKGIKIFGYEILIEKKSEKISKFLKKNNIEAFVISIEKTTQVDRTVVIIIMSWGEPVNYRLTLLLLSFIVFFFSFTLGHFAMF